MTAARPVVPLVDLHAAFAAVRGDVLQAFTRVLDGMQLLLGPETQAFEREFADYCGTAHGVAVASGTDALFAALVAAGIGPGDEVIVPAHTFFATVEAILHTGASPVFVDVEPARLGLDVEQVRAAIGPTTKAIVPVHLYGHPADMDEVLVLAAEHALLVVEDAAQAHGARHRGRRCGAMGDAGCFSFYVTKNLAALGEGGFVTTNDATLAERVRLLRHHGHVSKFEHAVAGWNLRMDELQAAVLRVRLPRLEAGNARRRVIAARYRAAFADTPVTELMPADEAEAVHHVHPVRVAERDALREWLGERGIETGIHYAVPAHRQPALSRRPHRCQGSLPVTEAACRELLSLPIYPELSDEQVELVIAGVQSFIESRPAGASHDGLMAAVQVGRLPAADAGTDVEVTALLAACPAAVAQQTPAWRDVIASLGVDEPLWLGCRQDGRLVGVLPAYRFTGPLGAILTSSAQAGPLGGVACHPAADPEPVYAALLDAYVALAAEHGCALATVITNPFLPDQERCTRHLRPEYRLQNVCQVLDLETALDGAGDLVGGSANLRRNLRRATSEALTVDETQSEENVHTWWTIHDRRHREIGARPLPRALFMGALRHAVPRQVARFFFARHADTGEMVAGGLYLHHGAVMDALMPSGSTASAPLRAMYRLALHSMRWAQARGVRHYNWQGSPPGGGVERFKRQWGSRDVSYQYLTRVTGDIEPILRATPEVLASGYPWHFVLPFDRLGGAASAEPSSRAGAWRALETGES